MRSGIGCSSGRSASHAVPTHRCPDQPAAVVVDHHGEVTVAALVRDLIDADAAQASEAIDTRSGFGADDSQRGRIQPPGFGHYASMPMTSPVGGRLRHAQRALQELQLQEQQVRAGRAVGRVREP